MTNHSPELAHLIEMARLRGTSLIDIHADAASAIRVVLALPEARALGPANVAAALGFLDAMAYAFDQLRKESKR